MSSSMELNLLEKRQRKLQGHLNWLKQIVEIPHGLEAFKNQSFTDFKILVGKRTFLVSKVILAMKSEVFKTMFESGMKEAHTGELILNDDDEESVEAMLLFIYGNKKVEDFTTAVKVRPYTIMVSVQRLHFEICFLFDTFS
ncbi:unnamed protein product [Bursaphelenchus okinawaensis]|uniref:BTB domain-containing protein n=1 Tax=Bursaphelenchus okinawaensis TaxID=465554 RepID=A0A811KPQ7_9BILA|nr:unnamed protein product [Bursaphelenchus okinawaensis]CAG9107014.1 unnamed protein product [Bursaphelenchus okinawaensis]